MHVPSDFESRFSGPNQFTMLSKLECANLYSLMTAIRRMEISSDQLYKQRLVRGFCHLYSGQEAIAAGVESSLTFEDMLITAYRDHGNFVARGGTTEHVIAELLGRHTGASKGKGGSMHMYHRKNNFFGGNGIVGAQVPIGTGLAYALKYGKSKPTNVAMILYGDGAANQGQVFEAFNMAALWKLPAIFACENNKYGMGTSSARAAAHPSYYDRVKYIPGMLVDGMDIFAVREATRYAKEWAIEHGPVVMELGTYRYSGHSMSDPGTTYRSREEITDVRSTRDPLTKMRAVLLENKVMTDEELNEIEARVRQENDDAIERAKKAPEPLLKELGRDVYAGNVWPARGVMPGSVI